MDVAFHIYRASLVVEKKIGSFRYILIFINEKIFHKTFFFFHILHFIIFFLKKKKIYYDYLICILLKPSVLAPRILFIFFVLFYFIFL